jgi:hypothetical protein
MHEHTHAPVGSAVGVTTDDRPVHLCACNRRIVPAHGRPGEWARF